MVQFLEERKLSEWELVEETDKLIIMVGPFSDLLIIGLDYCYQYPTQPCGVFFLFLLTVFFMLLGLDIYLYFARLDNSADSLLDIG